MTRKVVPPPRRAVQIDAAAEGVHSVLEPQKPGAAGKFGTSHTVIGDLQPQRAVDLLSLRRSP